ncbi:MULTISPECIES: hypothetical protein [unclassified Thermoactinomyces]|uniref:hypothetical protein n=1 Tax=unclassified Thermoactinomyces TaxID=2634588 RepID=UPI0018DCBB93|nr:MULTISPECIES: hypothetical protein [unclassified Thermoactinomyces]MBH8599512.1 hypothetical protein [Thermoactinomyces sp. CICC 10523]MBH8608975.1 hypothetical protein [Thermoactinomyces sp. CICC 10521]
MKQADGRKRSAERRESLWEISSLNDLATGTSGVVERFSAEEIKVHDKRGNCAKTELLKWICVVDRPDWRDALFCNRFLFGQGQLPFSVMWSVMR